MSDKTTMSKDRKQMSQNRKRGRSSSPESDYTADTSRRISKRWKGPGSFQPDLLQEMGLSVLEDDAQLSDDDDNSAEEIIASSSEDNENVSSVLLKKSKRVMTKSRKPFKYIQHTDTINVSPVGKLTDGQNTDDAVHQKDQFPEVTTQTNSCKLEKLKPVSCKIKNSQIIYQNEGLENNNKKHCDAADKEMVPDHKPLCNYLSTDDDDDVIRRLPPKKGQDYITSLADELLLNIFMWLPRKSVMRCALVCKKFLRIALDEELWTRSDLSSRTLQSKVVLQVMSRGCRIFRLANSLIMDPVDRGSCNFTGMVCKLQFLDLSMANISSFFLEEVLGLCRYLKKLSLENCTVNNACGEAIAKNSDIEVLNLSMCTGVSSIFIDVLLTNCKKLQSLNLAWTNLSTVSLDIIAQKIPHRVERLNISGCRKTLQNEHVVDILNRCEDLVELDVSDSNTVTGHIIDYIAELDSKLQYIALSRCYSITLNCLKNLDSVSSLMYVDVFGLLSETEIAELKRYLRNINFNQFPFSSIARPTVGLRRTSIWGLRVRE